MGAVHSIALNENETFCLARFKSAIIPSAWSTSLRRPLLFHSSFSVSIAFLYATNYNHLWSEIFSCCCCFFTANIQLQAIPFCSTPATAPFIELKCLRSFSLLFSFQLRSHLIHARVCVCVGFQISRCWSLVCRCGWSMSIIDLIIFKFHHLHVPLIDSNQINDLIDLPWTKCRRLVFAYGAWHTIQWWRSSVRLMVDCL